MMNNVIPHWDYPKLPFGTMVRTALWLIQVVGLGNVFTKEQHRKAFAGVTQADRRMRDLRAHGWVIHTSLEDVSLNQNEQRFVAMGVAVWDPAARERVGPPKLTDKQRMSVFAKGDFQCRICGIAGGERYTDLNGVTAVLSVAGRTVARLDGTTEVIYQVECKRCNAGRGPGGVEDIHTLLAQIGSLGRDEKAAIIKLIAAGDTGRLSELWKKFRQMSVQSRAEIQQILTS